MFLTQATSFIKFVKQVFQQQQTSSSEPGNRWQLIDRGAPSRGRGEGKRGDAVKSNQMSPIREYPCTSAPLSPLSLSPSLLPSRQSHPSLPTSADMPVLHKKKQKNKGEAICVRGHCNLTLDARLHVAACEKTKAGKATQKMCRSGWGKKKKKLAEIRNAEPNMRTEVQVD